MQLNYTFVTMLQLGVGILFLNIVLVVGVESLRIHY